MKNSTNQTNFCNPLSQLDSFLISTEEFQENLSHAKSARILVFSDSHGNRQQLERILSYFSGHIDAIAFCGDGISDLLSIIEDVQDCALPFSIPPVTAFVCGNNDSSAFPMEFPVSCRQSACSQIVKIPQCLVFTACGHKIFMTHGHRYGVYSSLENLEHEAQIVGADFVFFGHTHVPQFEYRKCILLNPGSISLPRSYSSPSFAMVTIFEEKKQMEASFYRIERSGNQEFYKLYSPESFILH